MKLATKFAVVFSTVAVLSGSALFAGDMKSFKESKVVIIEDEPAQWWNADLSTGWDSLYMFRGVNILPGFENYGSSLYWTDLSVTFNLSENDFLTLGSWVAFGISDTNYKEFDGYAAYTHTFGNLAVSLGYTYYHILSETFGLYSHELSVGAAYAIAIGPVTVTPGVNYFFNVGPKPGQRGFAEQASSYLEGRVDVNIPIYQDVVALTPYASFGTNFRYNLTERGDSPNPFTGGNDAQVGIAMPITLSEVVSVAPYGAFSYQWNDLIGTEPTTFWGGGSVTFSF
jgi:hypothetical protein